MARALITGITGQDGRYLVDLLSTKGYEIFGLVRAAEQADPRLQSKTTILEGDLLDGDSLKRAVRSAAPDEIYHLGAQSVPSDSRHVPVLTAEVNASGTIRLLEAVRSEAVGARVCFASSSEIFAHATTSPQNELTPHAPRNIYGITKLCGQLAIKDYRDNCDMHASTAILFNHESPLRPTSFVTRKVTNAVAEIVHGRRQSLELGDLSSSRDWGFAGDYVHAMWLMVNQSEPNDYVIGTGVSHSVQDLCQIAFSAVGLNWKEHVKTDPALLRQPETTQLVSDPARAERELGWSATTSFRDLVEMMVLADLAHFEVATD